MRKELTVAIYSARGGLLGTWDAFRFAGFRKELNAGLGDCTITLPLAFDSASATLTEGNIVELRIADNDTLAAGPRTIYRGYISRTVRYSEGGRDGIEVTLLGFYTLLGVRILKNGAQTTLYSNASAGLTTASGSQGAADIGLMVRAVMDRYAAEHSDSSIFTHLRAAPNTSTTATYTFQQKTYREALERLRLMAPVGTFYYVNENGLLTFGQKPATATHTFVLGRHFSDVSIERNLENMRNTLLLWDGKAGGTYKRYADAGSIQQYGARMEANNDFGMASVAAADLIGAKFLDETAQPEVKVRATILDNGLNSDKGYDIESIQPGDTCTLQGFNPNIAALLREAMLITSVEYHLDRAVIEVQAVKSGLVDFQQQQGQQLRDLGNGGLSIPASYS